MKRPGRRSILRMIALLLAWLIAGATLNVAVAWGCAVWGQWDDYGYIVHPKDIERRFGQLPPTLPELTRAYERTGFGWTAIERNGWGDRISPSAGREHVVQDIELLGLPARSMQSERNQTNWSSGLAIHRFSVGPIPSSWTSEWRDERRLPLRPLWPGFAINTLFYAAVLWMLFAGAFALRRMIRRRRGRCPHCNYPIGQSPVCTECGAAIVRSGG